ncbi:M23 family metallopeptidase [Planococcus sp. APC 4015]|nr:M23 family metallopeptidase [Planococcus sp. APC 4015]
MTAKTDAVRPATTLLLLLLCVLVLVTASLGVPPAGAVTASPALDDRGWMWPVSSFRLHRPYQAPPNEYGPGHRGVDVLPSAGELIRAPADGVVAFAGAVAGRELVTIDHGDGLVTTLEPVAATVEKGAAVARGATVGTVGFGGHADPGTLHFGVRLHGEYINPMLLLGGVPRAVLLPCC